MLGAALEVDWTVATERIGIRMGVVDGRGRRKEESRARRQEAQTVIMAVDDGAYVQWSTMHENAERIYIVNFSNFNLKSVLSWLDCRRFLVLTPYVKVHDEPQIRAVPLATSHLCTHPPALTGSHQLCCHNGRIATASCD